MTETTLTPASDAPIGIDEEREYTYTFTPGADSLGEMTFALSLPTDDVLVGNSYKATGTVVVGDAVMPPSLTAERRKDEPGTVDLAWGSPYVFDGTETMEMLPPFSIDEKAWRLPQHRPRRLAHILMAELGLPPRGGTPRLHSVRRPPSRDTGSYEERAESPRRPPVPAGTLAAQLQDRQRLADLA